MLESSGGIYFLLNHTPLYFSEVRRIILPCEILLGDLLFILKPIASYIIMKGISLWKILYNDLIITLIYIDYYINLWFVEPWKILYNDFIIMLKYIKESIILWFLEPLKLLIYDLNLRFKTIDPNTVRLWILIGYIIFFGTRLLPLISPDIILDFLNDYFLLMDGNPGPVGPVGPGGGTGGGGPWSNWNGGPPKEPWSKALIISSDDDQLESLIKDRTNKAIVLYPEKADGRWLKKKFISVSTDISVYLNSAKKALVLLDENEKLIREFKEYYAAKGSPQVISVDMKDPEIKIVNPENNKTEVDERLTSLAKKMKANSFAVNACGTKMRNLENIYPFLKLREPNWNSMSGESVTKYTRKGGIMELLGF